MQINLKPGDHLTVIIGKQTVSISAIYDMTTNQFQDLMDTNPMALLNAPLAASIHLRIDHPNIEIKRQDVEGITFMNIHTHNQGDADETD